MQTVQLKTDSIVSKFKFDCIEAGAGFVDGEIDVAMSKGVNDWPMPPIKCRLYKSDLERLLHYFENHIDRLLSNSASESPVFVPGELGFQIRALDGDVESKLDGYFTIELFINYGPKGKNGDSMYLGYSGTIDLVNVNEFCAKIGNIAVEL